MIKTKSEVSNYIVNECKKILRNPKAQNSVITKLNTQYGIPEALSFDLITLKVEAVDETDFVLFCLLSVLCPNKINTSFTTKEINAFSNSKYKIEKIKFPLKLKMIQVSDDQWIGSISVKQLMKLRDAQLINYNENAQRRLKRIVSGEEEWYTIDLNRDAVDKITESYRNETYIANTITLNIPEDAEFHYDGENLIINEVNAFDILDGYHRYIAMSNIYNTNRKFDYTMEIRVVCFSEDKARQFIWQEDQKTKMKKIDSEALNQNNPATQVTTMLASKGIMNGIISRNKGTIDYTSISQLIGLLFFNTKKKVERKQIIEIRELLYKKFDQLSMERPDIFDKKWDNKFTAATIFIFSKEYEDNLYQEISEFYNKISQEEYDFIFTGRTFTTQTISRLNKIYEGGL